MNLLTALMNDQRRVAFLMSRIGSKYFLDRLCVEGSIYPGVKS